MPISAEMKLRAAARQVAQAMTDKTKVLGCVTVVALKSGQGNLLIESSAEAKKLVRSYIDRGLTHSDPMMIAALNTPGTYLWKIPKFSDERTIWCDVGEAIVRAHSTLGSIAGFWTSAIAGDCLIAHCLLGADLTVHNFEKIEQAKTLASSLDQTLAGLCENWLSAKQQLLDKKLTNRETEIISLLSQGYSQVEAAEKLKITVRTVSFHVQNIKRRLNVNSTAEALVMVANANVLIRKSV